MELNLSWQEFKAIVVQRSLDIQYIATNGAYYLGALDGAFTILCYLQRSLSSSVDQTDFEKNFKALANRPLIKPSSVLSEVLKPVINVSSQSSDQSPFIPFKVLLNKKAINASGSEMVDNLGPYSMIVMTVRIAGPVSGTTPQLAFTLADIDPSSAEGSVSLTGNQLVTTTFTSTVTAQTFIFVTKTGKMQLSWSVSGTTPFFGNVSLSLSTLPETKKVALTASAPMAVSVGVATGLALAANVTRRGLALVNTSTAIISLGIGASAVLYSGITLYPGGVWEMDESTFTTAAINAIASAAASNLAVQELTI